ncbi:MAG TPA: cellulase family glycosylhydrolase [Kofleriaceae bacterium]|nr:cellulase family glycosylhydrolase [Kofleriaceae bacterium]
MRAWVFAVLAACGSSHGKSDAPRTGGEPANDTGGGSADLWLDVVGTHIVHHADGTRFHGRGADLHDERSCEACSFMPADPNGVDRWSDELIDNWHASFVRFLLSAKSAPYNSSEVQWKSLVDDPQYLADIVQNVTHMTSKPGVYVEVTVFMDPSMKPENSDFDSEWPSSAGDTLPVYRALAEAFYANPKVLFGLTNEPHGSADHDAALAAVYQTAIQAIRAVEDSHGTPHHLIVAQAPENYARDLTYFIANPLPGDRIIYEVHPYNTQADFDRLITQPAMHLPIMIGEYGPAGVMTNQDIQALWPVAQAAEVPYIAWVFHQRCPPSMLQDTGGSAYDNCGLDAATGYNFPRTAWGDLLHDHLATPW